MEEWVYIVKAMQQITINKQGGVVSMGAFKSTDKDENTDWVKWNQDRDVDWLQQLRKNR